VIFGEKKKCREAKKHFIIKGLLIPFAFIIAPTAGANDEQEITTIVDDLLTNINDNDVDSTLALLNENFVLINIPGDVSVGKEEIRQYFDKMIVAKDAYLKSARFDMSLDAKPLISNDQHAFVRGRAVNYYQFSVGGSLDLPTFWTATRIKTNGEWKLSTFHISANVFQNPLLDELYWIVFAVLIVSTSTVGAGAYLTGRRRPRSLKSINPDNTPG